MTDTLALPLAQELLAALCAALNANPDPPALCSLRFGEEVTQDMGELLDECCAGLAWVRITGPYPSFEDFPNEDSGTALSGCGVLAWAVPLEMGVFRCVPVGDENYPPTSAELTAAATQMANDQAAMRAALCAFLANRDPGEVAVGRQAQKGPAGGCAGTLQLITVQV